MADIASAAIAAADFLLNIANSTIFKDLQPSDLGDHESDTEWLSLCIERTKNKLCNVDEQQLDDPQKGAFKKIREAVLDAEDILDRVQTLTKKKKLKEANDVVARQTDDSSTFPSFISTLAPDIFYSGRNNADEVLNDIKKIDKKLVAIEQYLQTFGLKEPSDAKMSARATGSHVNAKRIMGRDKDKTEVINLLSRPSTCKERIPVVSVVGMGGMGKTTLAQLVFDDKSWQQDFKFDLQLWVPDSKKLDLKSLLKSVMKSIRPSDTSLDNLEENHLKNRLVEEIRGKRFLLVLDDVENEDRMRWIDVEDLFSEGIMEGCRILVTTRSKRVTVVMGSSDSTYELTSLSEDVSLQLFESWAFGETRDENLVKIGKLIVKKCVGVPLALKVIGSLLYGQDKCKWERVFNFGLASLEVKSNQLLPILKMSYHDLYPTLKQCFSYCALFPKNYRISKGLLSSIWMANVCFKINNGDTIQVVCNENLEILCNRCFLEVDERLDWDNDTYYKVHDLMHDLAKDVAGAEMHVVDFDARVDSNKLIIEENVRHLNLRSLPLKDIGTFELKGRRLRTILQYSPFSREHQLYNGDKLVSGSPFLRFLDLSWCSIDNLSNSIGKLIHLRYLHLYGSDIQTLDSITELINLRYLRLTQCKTLTHLPSGVGGLTSLELLDISGCEKLEELPMGIDKLTNLRNLNLAWCKALTHLPSGVGGLTSLELLDISWCVNLKELPMGIEKLTNLKELKFEGCTGLTKMPSGMGALLSICRPHRFIVGHPKSKHTAQLEELDSVSELIQGELQLEFPSNITLKAPTRDGEAFLLNKKLLRKLKIQWRKEEVLSEDSCETPKEEINHMHNPEEEVPGNHMDIMAKLQPPPNLEEFTLQGYQGMEFPAWDFASALPNLQKILIFDCKRFRHLPPLSRLTRLKYMKLDGLSSLEYIEEDVSSASFCPSLEKLVLDDLPELKGWCRGGLTTGTVEQEQLVMLPSFPRLVDLYVSGCPNLMVAPILVSFVKVFSVNRQVEKELSEKREETASSSVSLFAEICRNDGTFHLSMKEEENHEILLKISDWKASSIPPPNMGEAFREMSKHLTRLHIYRCSGLNTLPGLQHLTALQRLTISGCDDFTGEEEQQIKSNSLQTCSQDAESPWKGLQSLEELTLVGLPKMERLPEGIQFLTSLRELYIWGCDNLTGQCGELPWKGLQSLEELTLDMLPKMERLPEGIQFLTSLRELYISKCDNLTVPEWVHKTFKRDENVGWRDEYRRVNNS